MGNISSLTVKDGVLLITDLSSTVYQWEHGKAPVVFQAGNAKQRFTSALSTSNQRYILTDVANDHFLISADGPWQSFSSSGDQEREINKPTASAWSEQGIVYIADYGNNRISAFSDEGLFLFTFGDEAPQEDKDQNLNKILEIKVDRLGRVYVLDSQGGGRVMIYSSTGELDTMLGKEEFKLLLNDSLALVAMTIRPDGVLMLADKKSGRILEVDWENMEVLSSFGTVGRGRGQFQRISSMALDNNGKLYIADRGNKKIEIFQLPWIKQPWLNLTADKLSIHPSSTLKSACDVSYLYTGEQILCINTKANSVTIRSHDGAILQTLTAKFDTPIRAAFDEKEIFILDEKDVKIFDTQGKFKFNFGGPGRRDGEFSDASHLTISSNLVFITDTGNKRIQTFSRNGLFQQSIGQSKEDAILLQEPVATAVNKNGFIFVADQQLHKILVYSPKGKLVHQLGGQTKEHLHAFQTIYDLYIDHQNALHVMASTATNPLAVWVFQKSLPIYRYSPSNQEAEAGFDQQWSAAFTIDKTATIDSLTAAARKAIHLTTPLSIDKENPLFEAKGGFFSKDAWIFNRVPNNPSTLALLDLTNHKRHTFTLSYAPAPVRGISINGDEQQVRLNWLAVSNDFAGYYVVYGRNDISSPFKVIDKTIASHLHFKREKFGSTEYRVTAVSPLEKESNQSSVYQDEFWLGYLAFKANRFDQALGLLNQAIITNPQHAVAWSYLGQTQMALNALDEASNTFIHLSQFKGWAQQSIHFQAQSLIKKESWLDVKSLVDSAESNGNVDALLYSVAANALIQMDDIPSAIYYLDQAVSLEPSSYQWHLALADANYDLGAEESAQNELLAASKLAVKNAQAWLEIAQSYKKHQLLDHAITSYNNTLGIEPTHSLALSELATLYLQKNNLIEAKSLATKMAGIKTLKGTSYYILGRVSLLEGKAPQALGMLAKAGQSDPNNGDIWLAMANAYVALNKPNREAEYLRKAIAVDENNFEVHLRLGKICVAKKDSTCAKNHYLRAVSINKHDIAAQLGLTQVLIRAGNMVEANLHAKAALKLNPSFIPSLITLAEVQSARGMIPDSIATLKKAMILDDTNIDVHISLSKAYIVNHMYAEATEVSEKAMLLDVRNAAPLILLGSIYLARQSFDEAIASFEKAVSLAPDNAKYRQQLNMAFLQKKRLADSGGSMLGPKLKQLHFSRVFSAAYKQYTDVPVGKLTLVNEAGVDYANVKVSLFVKEYMDFPTTTVVERIPAGGEIEISLLAAFNNKILDIDEDTGVQTEVRAEYYLAGKPHAETLNESLTIYGKNAIIWDKLDMVGSFATPKDDTLAVFIRQLVNAYTPKGGAVNPRVAKAMTVYNGLSAYGIKYLIDPNTPYGKLDAFQLDTIQFPRETLRQRSGDCDDLSILLSASLSNLGIETAILDVPAHLLMMFNTGVSESRKDTISLNDQALAIIDGQVWIPLEATLIASSFTEAWAEGARKYHLYGQQAKMKIMPLATAWEKYPPVTLPPAEFGLEIPDQVSIGDKISKEWDILSVKALERLVAPYRIMLALDKNNTQAHMQIAVVYARNGLYKKAAIELEVLKSQDENNTAVLNNLGNIHYMRQEYQKALNMYQLALDLDPNNANIRVNIAMANYKMGDALQAKVLFDQATAIDDQVPVRYEQLAFLLHQ